MRNLEDPTQEFENFLPMEDSRRWSQLVEFTTNQRNKSWKVVRNVLREYHSLLLSETFDIWYWQWWHLTSPFKENRLILGSDFEFFKSLASIVIFGKSLLDWIKVTKNFFSGRLKESLRVESLREENEEYNYLLFSITKNGEIKVFSQN